MTVLSLEGFQASNDKMVGYKQFI